MTPVPSMPRVQRIGAIVWPSFFSAGVATMVCFALLDPHDLREVVFPSLDLSREIVYTIGFFAFWAATLGASLFTAVLLRAPRR